MDRCRGEELCCNTGGSDNAGAKEGTLAGGAGPRPESPDRPDTGRGNTGTGSDVAMTPSADEVQKARVAGPDRRMQCSKFKRIKNQKANGQAGRGCATLFAASSTPNASRPTQRLRPGGADGGGTQKIL